jgi:hypothetical protein
VSDKDGIACFRKAPRYVRYRAMNKTKTKNKPYLPLLRSPSPFRSTKE